MMADPKRISPRLRVLIFIACLAVVSFCTFLLWPRAQRVLPIPYQAPVVDDSSAPDVAPPPPKPPGKSTPEKLSEAELAKAKGELDGTWKTKWEKPKDFKIIGVIFCTLLATTAAHRGCRTSDG